MKKYNKLVRDLIPEVIEADGKKCETEIVYGEEKTKFLEDKLKEEVDEYLEDKNLEELADVMEVYLDLHIILDIVKKIYLIRDKKSLKNVVDLKTE